MVLMEKIHPFTLTTEDLHGGWGGFELWVFLVSDTGTNRQHMVTRLGQANANAHTQANITYAPHRADTHTHTH